MPNRSWLAPGLAAAVLAAACSSKESAPPLSASGGSNSGGAAVVTKGGASSAAGGSASGGATASAGDAGAGGEGGALSDPSPALCDEAQAWGAAQRLAVSSSGADVLAGVSSDERCLAWLADGVLYYAERQSANADFGAATKIEASTDYFRRCHVEPRRAVDRGRAQGRKELRGSASRLAHAAIFRSFRGDAVRRDGSGAGHVSRERPLR
ncbi:MAG: hypothetical protein QM756_28715 [Polyangiaceae bacterium]